MQQKLPFDETSINEGQSNTCIWQNDFMEILKNNGLPSSHIPVQQGCRSVVPHFCFTWQIWRNYGQTRSSGIIRWSMTNTVPCELSPHITPSQVISSFINSYQSPKAALGPLSPVLWSLSSECPLKRASTRAVSLNGPSCRPRWTRQRTDCSGFT